MIRLIVVVLFVTLFLIVSIPLFLMELIIGLFSPHARDISSLRIVQWAFRVILVICRTKLTVIGEENVPKDRAVLYIANHRSFFDVIIAYARCPRATGFMSKKEILRVPLLSTWMKFLHCLFVDRGDMRSGIRVIQEAAEDLKNGISVFIFPEGTRNKEDETMLPFKTGAFKAAQKAGAPIVMLALNNTRAIYEDGKRGLKRAHVVLEYSEPIDPSQIEGGYKAVSAYCQEHLQEMIDRNRALV